MKAVIIKGKDARLVRDRPLPKLRPGYLLVRPHAVALNPTDWKHVAFERAKTGALVGCDYSGVVEEVGPGVNKIWGKGDRVCGCTHGSNLVNEEDGAFAEYIVAKGDVQIKIPNQLSFEKAATVSLGAITVGQGLFQKSLKLNLPTDPIQKQEYVLIYGGGTATGGLAIQFAKLSGYTVITLGAPQDFERLSSLGADFCFDYLDVDASKEIRSLTNNKLRYAWDTIGQKSSAEICAICLSTEPGTRYGATNFVKCPRPDVESSSVVMYTMFGEAFKFGSQEFAASSEDFEFAKLFMSLTENLLKEGKLRTHTERVEEGGLAGVIKGLSDLKAGKADGCKLVYRVAETQ